jgi:hypothetical protein
MSLPPVDPDSREGLKSEAAHLQEERKWFSGAREVLSELRPRRRRES